MSPSTDPAVSHPVALTVPESSPPRWQVPARILAAAVSGALVVVASPPIGQAWTQWFNFVPFLLVLDGLPGPARPWGLLRRRDAQLGYACGVALVFANFLWLAKTITLFSNLPWIAACAVVALFAMVWGLPYALVGALARPFRARFGAAWPVLFAALWTAVEKITPAVFPYFVAAPQYRTPWVWQIVSVLGVSSMTFLVVFVNASLAECLLRLAEHRKDTTVRLPWTTAGLASAAFLANLAFGAWRTQRVETQLMTAPILRASILQQGVSMVTRIQDRGSTVLKSWETLTARVLQAKPDLVVWPEGSIYYNPTDPKLAKRFGEMTRTGNFSFLVGGGTRERDPLDVERTVNFNSVYLFDPQGNVTGRYDKMVPLPFGEYLPWPFSYLRGVIEGVGNFRAGTHPTVFKAGNWTLSTPICYEAILESQMRTMSEVDLFVNITNDGWFGDTAAPHQHAMLAAVHATEFGRPMLRIAYTGVSMVVEPHGAIRYETAPYTDVAEVVPIRMTTIDTPYRRWGRAFPWLCVAVGASAGALVLRGSRTASTTDSTPST